MYMVSRTVRAIAEDLTFDIASGITMDDSLRDGMTGVSSNPAQGKAALRPVSCDGNRCIEPYAVSYHEGGGNGGNSDLSTENGATAWNVETITNIVPGNADIQPYAFSYMCQDHIVSVETSLEETKEPFHQGDGNGGNSDIFSENGATAGKGQTIIDKAPGNADIEPYAFSYMCQDHIVSVETSLEEAKEPFQKTITAVSSIKDVSTKLVICHSSRVDDGTTFARDNRNVQRLRRPPISLHPNQMYAQKDIAELNVHTEPPLQKTRMALSSSNDVSTELVVCHSSRVDVDTTIARDDRNVQRLRHPPISLHPNQMYAQNDSAKLNVNTEPPLGSANSGGKSCTKSCVVQYQTGDKNGDVEIPTKSNSASEDEETFHIVNFHVDIIEPYAVAYTYHDDIEESPEEMTTMEPCQKAKTASSSNDDVSAKLVRCDYRNDDDTMGFPGNDSARHDILHPPSRLQPNSICDSNTRDPNLLYHTSTLNSNPTSKEQNNPSYDSLSPQNAEKSNSAYGQNNQPDFRSTEVSQSEGILRIDPYAIRYQEDDDISSDIRTRGPVAENGQTVDIDLGDNANIEPIQPYAVAFGCQGDMPSDKKTKETHDKESSKKTTSDSNTISTSMAGGDSHQNDAVDSVSKGQDKCNNLRRSPDTFHANPMYARSDLIPNPMYAPNVGQQAIRGKRCCLAVVAAIVLLVSLTTAGVILAMFLSTHGSPLVAQTVNTTYTTGQSDMNTTYIPGQSDLNSTYIPGQSDVNTTYIPGQSNVNTTYTTGQSGVDTTYTTGQSDVNTTYTTGQSDVNTTYATGQSDMNITDTTGQSAILFQSDVNTYIPDHPAISSSMGTTTLKPVSISTVSIIFELFFRKRMKVSN
uniref:Uncharacterized protein n=1 Tax=Branchiostoma floridae TaxID=7739 RepID=C3YVF3_BRAFL|eukprot:XP_002599664.1 hypothetical protein BRAFLDRAFT_70344 [Branchiostoma floridae]